MAVKTITLADADYKRIFEMAKRGMTVEGISAVLGIKKRTFEAILERDEKAKETIEQGRQHGIDAVTNVAFKMATSGKCPAMTIFFLKTRAQWREVQRVENTVEIVDNEKKSQEARELALKLVSTLKDTLPRDDGTGGDT